MPNKNKEWPLVPGDFDIINPNSCVAVCTLGKKIDVSGDYAIIGTCKTENIGIERMIVNVISNPCIRFFLLAGPEVPGHRAGSSLRCLYENGVDAKTHKIIDAPGAIPYVENIPEEGIERFRQQVEFIDMMNVSDPGRISEKIQELISKDPGPFPAEPIWIEFRAASGGARPKGLGVDVMILPEYSIAIDPWTSLVSKQEGFATVTMHPTAVGVQMVPTENGIILVGKEM